MIIGHDKLTLLDFEDLLFKGSKIELSQIATEKVSASHYFLKEFSKDKIIYGINTGFGPMAQYRIADDERIQLQYNLIRSHCSGSGEPLSELQSKAILISRLNSLLLGYSGIHEDAIQLMTKMVNAGLYPVIYQHGGVGACCSCVDWRRRSLVRWENNFLKRSF